MKTISDPVSTYLDGLREGRRHGFAECLALLREPSEAVLQAAAKAAFEAVPNSTWEPEAKAALRAAADAIDSERPR